MATSTTAGGTPWQISLLPNGLRVVTTPVPTAEAACVTVFVGVGSRAEARAVNGVSHFMEHMLFKGTERRRDALTIAAEIEGAGGVLNAYTSKELTCYWNQVPFEMLATAIDVAADMVQHSVLDETEVERERTVVQQEIRRSHDQPSSWVGELLSQAVYGDQPIGWSIAGSIESVQGISRADMRQHLDTWYVPANIVLSVAGRVQHEQVVDLASRAFDQQTQATLPPVATALPELAPDHFRYDQRDIAQANMAIGFRSLGRTDPDRFALTIMTNILGRGMSSRLFREVRERRGLAYSVGASASRYADTGTFAVSAGVSPEHAVEATQVIMSELTTLLDTPVGEDELRKARDFATGSFRLGLETSMALAQRAGDGLLALGRIEGVTEIVDGLQGVTAADVQRVAGRVFGDTDAAMAVVGPKLDVDGLQTALR